MDPYGQYDSPYMAMGNSPVMLFDMDGGWSGGGDGKPGFFGRIWGGITSALGIRGKEPIHELPEVNVYASKSPAKNSWNNTATALVTSGALVADDVTGIGAIDDVAIPFIIAAGVGYDLYENGLFDKMNREIDGILRRAPNGNGFQYKLVATVDGMYENVRGGKVPLKEGDVWKYGETTRGLNRYTRKYLEQHKVRMVPQFFGSVVEIKVQEKIMIYGHFAVHGSLPAGNKIFR